MSILHLNVNTNDIRSNRLNIELRYLTKMTREINEANLFSGMSAKIRNISLQLYMRHFLCIRDSLCMIYILDIQILI